MEKREKRNSEIALGLDFYSWMTSRRLTLSFRPTAATQTPSSPGLRGFCRCIFDYSLALVEISVEVELLENLEQPLSREEVKAAKVEVEDFFRRPEKVKRPLSKERCQLKNGHLLDPRLPRAHSHKL